MLRQCQLPTVLFALVVASGLAPRESLAQATPACDALPAMAPLDPHGPFALQLPDSLSNAPCTGGLSWRALRPTARIAWRSGVPDARGDGAATSAVGANAHLRAGLELQRGAFAIRFAPELTAVEDRDHQTFPSGDPARHPFASPFYFGGVSADLPSRRSETVRAWWGESGVHWQGAHTSLAVTTALPDWGPGVGEGLVLGRSAPGLPRIEASLRRPTANGHLRARWLAGRVRESSAFDSDPTNDGRSVTGLRIDYASRGDLPLAIGLSRTVMNARPGRSDLLALLDPLRGFASDATIDMLGFDLVLSSPSSGTLFWLEATRRAPERSLGDLLRAPGENVAHRIGVSQLLREAGASRWTGAVEFVRLDQPRARADDPPNDLYTSPSVVHGWTHDGQPLGSGLGPGGQRQIGRLDRSGPVWDGGFFLERVRWNEDALYRQIAPAADRHDVTLQGGLWLARAWGGYHVHARLAGGSRQSYLFQGATSTPDGRHVNLGMLDLSFTLRPLQ